MFHSKRLFWIDIGALAILTLFIALFVMVTQTVTNIHIYDASWYANRGQLMWRGVFPDGFVYTAAYPVVLGAVHLLLRELATAGLFVNMVMFFGLLVGVYWIGRVLFHRYAGLTAALVLALNPELLIVTREVQPVIMFFCVVVWGVAAYLYLLDRPSYKRAILAGCIYTVALYTRFEGGLFAVLIFVASLQIYYRTHDARFSFSIFITATVIFVTGALLYLKALSAVTGEGGSFASVLHPFLEQPINIEKASWRVTAILHSLFYHWSPLVWLAIGTMVVLRPGRWVSACLLLSGLTIYYALAVYTLALFPFPSRAMFDMPFIALLIGLLLWRIHQAHRLGRWIVLVVLVILCMPGILKTVEYSQTPMFFYRQDEVAQSGRKVDAWLESQNLQDTPIISFCYVLAPYVNSHLRLIFRLSLTNNQHPNQPDSPLNLLPVMAREGQLFMQCTGSLQFKGSYYRDWDDYMENLEQQPYQFEEIGRVDSYVFYRVVQKKP